MRPDDPRSWTSCQDTNVRIFCGGFRRACGAASRAVGDRDCLRRGQHPHPRSWRRPAQQGALRSKAPNLVRQENDGLMLAHCAVRCLVHVAADKVGEDPDRQVDHIRRCRKQESQRGTATLEAACSSISFAALPQARTSCRKQIVRAAAACHFGFASAHVRRVGPLSNPCPCQRLQRSPGPKPRNAR